MQVLAEKLKQTLINISDKLAAIFGEPIAAAEKFIAENWKKLKKFFKQNFEEIINFNKKIFTFFTNYIIIV